MNRMTLLKRWTLSEINQSSKSQKMVGYGFILEALHMQIFDAKFKDETQHEQTELTITGLRSELTQKEIQLKNAIEEVEKNEIQLDLEIKEKKRLRVECE